MEEILNFFSFSGTMAWFRLLPTLRLLCTGSCVALQLLRNLVKDEGLQQQKEESYVKQNESVNVLVWKSSVL
jgi:hypothetical protein